MLYLEKELLELGRGQQHLGTSPKGLLRVVSRLSQTISEHQHTQNRLMMLQEAGWSAD
jgi:hypothetical protein